MRPIKFSDKLAAYSPGRYCLSLRCSQVEYLGVIVNTKTLLSRSPEQASQCLCLSWLSGDFFLRTNLAIY